MVAGPDAWRWVLYVIVPVGLAALMLAYRLVPARTGHCSRGMGVDLVGSLPLGGGVLSLLARARAVLAGRTGLLAAALTTIFYQAVTDTGQHYPTAISDTLLAASGFMLLALPPDVHGSVQDDPLSIGRCGYGGVDGSRSAGYLAK